jgi:hypothetical protein
MSRKSPVLRTVSSLVIISCFLWSFPAASILAVPAKIANPAAVKEEPTDAFKPIFQEVIGEFGAPNAKRAVELWLQGLKKRQGALQYAVMDEKLKKQFREHLDQVGGPTWATGVSSPWISRTKIVTETKINDHRTSFVVEVSFKTANGDAGKDRAPLSVQEEKNGWYIAGIEMGDDLRQNVNYPEFNKKHTGPDHKKAAQQNGDLIQSIFNRAQQGYAYTKQIPGDRQIPLGSRLSLLQKRLGVSGNQFFDSTETTHLYLDKLISFLFIQTGKNHPHGQKNGGKGNGIESDQVYGVTSYDPILKGITLSEVKASLGDPSNHDNRSGSEGPGPTFWTLTYPLKESGRMLTFQFPYPSKGEPNPHLFSIFISYY